MKVVIDDIWLCDDCLMIAVNGDASCLDFYYGKGNAAERLADIERGLEELGPHLVPDFDTETGTGIHEFSARGCDCCGDNLHGSRHRFAVLGE